MFTCIVRFGPVFLDFWIDWDSRNPYIFYLFWSSLNLSMNHTKNYKLNVIIIIWETQTTLNELHDP